MIIKVCGMRDSANIKEVDEIEEVTWMGFIFFPRSSRDVESLPEYLPQHTKRVGVFVNADTDTLLQRISDFGLDFVQLHGHETPEYCKELLQQTNGKVKIIKMIQIETLEDLNIVSDYKGIANYLLFETKTKDYGGSGRQFDWEILRHYRGSIPFLITGGIGKDDAERLKSFQHPMFAGIDLNSKFEISPALKDVEAIKTFIKRYKQ